eukprot:83546-Rhodomonas_salina.5
MVDSSNAMSASEIGYGRTQAEEGRGCKKTRTGIVRTSSGTNLPIYARGLVQIYPYMQEFWYRSTHECTSPPKLQGKFPSVQYKLEEK